jgi:hypothetical protein
VARDETADREAAGFRCRCDPTDLLEPPDPRPRAVADCPAHRARRAAQQSIERERLSTHAAEPT